MKKLQEILKNASCFLIVVITVVSLAAVFWRIMAKYIPSLDGSAFFWANEFELLVLNWVVVLGMMVVYTLDNDIRITLFFDKFGFSSQRLLKRIFNILDIIVWGVVVGWGSGLAMQEWHTPTPTLMWSRGCFIYFPFVVLGVFVVLFSAYRLTTSFKTE